MLIWMGKLHITREDIACAGRKQDKSCPLPMTARGSIIATQVAVQASRHQEVAEPGSSEEGSYFATSSYGQEVAKDTSHSRSGLHVGSFSVYICYHLA